MVGRFAPWKGQEQFLRAFAAAFPEGDERAIFIGTALFGEDPYERAVQQLARDLRVSDRVEFRGHRDDVFEELRHLDVLVHASILPEPFGQVIAEAGAAGVPVLASAGGGATEHLRDGCSALLHRPGDVSQLASHLRRIVGDPELRIRLAEQNRRWLGRLAPEEVSRRVLDVYRQVAR
jgi:glycosyltransferase involved in cell wall biosynthesis